MTGAVLNPAIGFGSCLIQLYQSKSANFKWVWIYSLLPFTGAILAVLFHEFVFKKTQEVLEEEYQEDDVDTLLEK